MVDKAIATSQWLRAAGEDQLKTGTRSAPKIQEKADIDHRESREILGFEEAVQVRGQKENRVRKQTVKQERPDRGPAETASPIMTDSLMLEKKAGGFEYLVAPIDDRGQEGLPLPEVLKSEVIREDGEELEPPPIVAITDGAKVSRQRWHAVFGTTLTIILDGDHSGKKCGT